MNAKVCTTMFVSLFLIALLLPPIESRSGFRGRIQKVSTLSSGVSASIRWLNFYENRDLSILNISTTIT